MARPQVIVTMPAYKAERTVEKTLRALPSECYDTIILVDDASPDQTVEVARELGLQVIVHPRNRGYGGNQKSCYRAALAQGADIVVLLHPDFQYDPARVPALIEPLLRGEADFTFGSRFCQGGDPRAGGMPLYRYVGNTFLTRIENLILGTQFAELHSGLKAYTANFLRHVPYEHYSDDFVFDSQMVIDAVLLGMRITEVPIPTRYTEESSSTSIRASVKYINETLGTLVAARLRRRDRWLREYTAKLRESERHEKDLSLESARRARPEAPARMETPWRVEQTALAGKVEE